MKISVIPLGLESEMTQLSLLLNEQHNILASLTDEKSAGANKSADEEENEAQSQQDAESMHATRAVKEMVPGFNGNLEGKTFLNEGALTELDGNDYRPIQRVFFFLFNDVLLVCKVKHDKYVLHKCFIGNYIHIFFFLILSNCALFNSQIVIDNK